MRGIYKAKKEVHIYYIRERHTHTRIAPVRVKDSREKMKRERGRASNFFFELTGLQKIVGERGGDIM